MKKIHRVVITVFFLIGFLEVHSQGFPNAPAHVWMYTNGTYNVYDDQVLQLIAQKCALFIPRTDIIADQTFFGMKSIYMRSHKWNANLPVLMYTDPTLSDTNSLFTYFLPDYAQRGYSFLDTLLLHDPPNIKTGTLIYYGGGPTPAILGNVTDPNFRNWIVSHIKDTLNSIGLDGIICDTYKSDVSSIADTLCNSNWSQPFCKQYFDGMKKLSVQFKSSLFPKLFIYNGLLASDFPNYTYQDSLLPLSDGAMVEFFGYTHYGAGDSSFTNQVLPNITEMNAHPQYHIFVNGRAKVGSYISYDADYRWQRYLYGSYLLGADSNTTFHYFVDFANPNTYGGRPSTPLEFYDDLRLNPGVPTGNFIVTNHVYNRKFSQGFVAVAPDAAGTYSITLSQAYYTPEGQVLSGTVTILPGQALILLNSPPPPRATIWKNFESPTEPTLTWEDAQILVQGNNHYLQVDSLSFPNREQHDLMLDWIRAESNFKTMSIQTRTGSSSARLLIIADVEDSAQKDMCTVLNFQLNGTITPSHIDSMFYFRLFKCPRGKGSMEQTLAKYIPVPSNSLADGQWHTTHINGDSLLRGTRYSFRRFAFMRIVGNMDVDNIILPDTTLSTYIPNIEPQPQVLIYPNPCNGKFFIQPSVGSGQWTVEAYNVLGESVYKASLKQVQGDFAIDLSKQPNGVYLIRILTDSGNLISQNKVVKIN